MNVNAEENLLPNGDFEKVNSSGETWQNGIQPEGWGVWLASGQGVASVTTDVYYSGNKAVQIHHQASAWTGLSTNVAINGGGKYQLSAWIKTKDVVSGAEFLLERNTINN